MAALKIVLKEKDPPTVDFEGVVARVDLDASTIAFDNGTVVPIVDGTKVVRPERGEEAGIETLEHARRALETGDGLVARGRGRFDFDDPYVLIAETIAFATGRRDT